MTYTYNVRRMDSEVIEQYPYTADEILCMHLSGAKGTVRVFTFGGFWYEFKEAI